MIRGLSCHDLVVTGFNCAIMLFGWLLRDLLHLILRHPASRRVFLDHRSGAGLVLLARAARDTAVGVTCIPLPPWYDLVENPCLSLDIKAALCRCWAW